MSYWSHHPELLEEVTIECLPTEWKARVESGKITLDDVPDDLVQKAMMEGTEDHFASMADYIEKDR